MTDFAGRVASALVNAHIFLQSKSTKQPAMLLLAIRFFWIGPEYNYIQCKQVNNFKDWH
jgi:hypothetical protein